MRVRPRILRNAELSRKAEQADYVNHRRCTGRLSIQDAEVVDVIKRRFYESPQSYRGQFPRGVCRRGDSLTFFSLRD